MQFLLLIASLWSIHVCLYFFFSCYICGQDNCKLSESKEEVQLTKCGFSSFVCVRALNLTTEHREGSKGVLCCWSPPLPFACLSDVLLGWAPHSDGVDKMTEGGHTPVNVNLAAKHRFPRSSEAPAHQNRKGRELYFIKGQCHRIRYLHKTYRFKWMPNNINYTVPALTQAYYAHTEWNYIPAATNSWHIEEIAINMLPDICQGGDKVVCVLAQI